MKYLIIGAGGTGGSIAGFMAAANKNVTLIARGIHLEAIRKNGLCVERVNDALNVPVKAMTEQEYKESGEKADVIFICVKGYSLESTYSLIEAASHEKTVVIPILNIYGTGEKIAEVFPDLEVLNGCIYIAAAITKPGVITLSGTIFRVVFGRVDGDISSPILKEVEKDLKESGIAALLTEHVRRDTFQKFSFVSPMAAVGAYYNSTAGDAQHPGEIRQAYCDCVKEIEAIAKSMGIVFEDDIVETNLKTLDALVPDCTASMQKDLAKGGNSEIDGLIFEVVRLGKKYGVPTPVYKKISAFFQHLH